MDPKKIKYDDFVGKVNDIAAPSQKKVTLSGFVGKSPDKDNVRVYHDESLGDYSEVNAEDVIHQESMQNSSLGGSVLWVKGDAKISHGNDSYHYDAKKEYFEGDIANVILPTTGIRTVCARLNGFPSNLPAFQVPSAHNSGGDNTFL